VAKKALNDAEILLGTEVLSIESIGDTKEIPKVCIRTADQKFELDDVVITVPLGCLKQGLPKISPPLPSSINLAIRNTSYSHLEKVCIAFSLAFWDSISKSETTSLEKGTRFQCTVPPSHLVV
jgi:monoamine oxidase